VATPENTLPESLGSESEEESEGTRSQRLQWLVQAGWLRVFALFGRPARASQILIYALYAYIAAFVSKWAVAWAVIAFLGPAWLLPGNAAVGTIAEVLPALMVSIFVFILGAFFVVNQQATQIHSNRASLLLLHDPRLQQAVARPLIISIATLALALLTSDQAGPLVASLALVLVLATGFTLVSAATLLPYLISRVTAPRNFVLYTLEMAEIFLVGGETGLVVYRAGILGEMLKRGVRSGDSLQLREALGGMNEFHDIYVRATEANPDARIHEYESGGVGIGWLGEEMVGALVSAGQEAIGSDVASGDANRIAISLARFGIKSAETGQREEYDRAVDGLGELGTCTQQMKAPGLVNAFAEPVFGLASQVEPALNRLGSEAASRALAIWALVIGYAIQHLGAMGHTQWDRSLRLWSHDAPFEDAHRYVETEEFQNGWANKLGSLRPMLDEDGEKILIPPGAEAVHIHLARAEAEHRDLLEQQPPGEVESAAR
jgi:hypothetical protein